MEISPYDLFLSYRRSDGSEVAQVLRHGLENRGYKVFLDVRDLPSGPFDKALGEVIESTPDFVPILTENAVAESNSEADWFLKEVAWAIQSQRNICPIVIAPVNIASTAVLPDALVQLNMRHAIKYSHEYCDQAIDRLCQLLTKAPRKRSLGIRLFWGIGSWRSSFTIGISFLSLLLFWGIISLEYFDERPKVARPNEINAMVMYAPIPDEPTNASSAVRQDDITNNTRGQAYKVATTPPGDLSLKELRASAAHFFRVGLWEEAASKFEELIDRGETLQSTVPRLITCLLNAHSELSPVDRARIERLLNKLETSGLADLATDLRQLHRAKLAPAGKP